ncbi:MAG: flagellar motor switch protein FliN [Candidatus Lambdaproteobacteria bacterium]|nr:flagellar motor switch protein FliN [Candidatus Lambdaproteobacteria bacterium]
MADDMDFESFDNLDDLDWSELESDISDKGGDKSAAAAPKAGGIAPDSNAAMVSGGTGSIDINYLLDVNLQVMVEVGSRMINISNILGYDHGSIIELDKLVGEPLDLLVNHKTVARGEVVVVNEKFALKITEILDPKDRLAFLNR